MSLIKYNDGDMVGPNNIIMIQRLYRQNNRKWMCEFKCPICGKPFVARLSHVTSGAIASCGCLHSYVCSKNLLKQKFGKLEVIKKTDKKSYDGRVIWQCKCDCGNIVEVSSKNLLDGTTSSCGCLRSKGEELLQKIFTNNSINFIKEYSFKDCKDKDNGKLRFDFYLPDYNCSIEYDGVQHFIYNKGWNTKDNYGTLIRHDTIKNNYCKNNNINLLRIPYTEFDAISNNNQILLDKIMELKSINEKSL